MKKNLILISLGTLMGCLSEQAPNPVDCSLTGPSVVLETKTDAQCGEADGSFSVTVTGGEGSVIYKLNSQVTESSGTFENLAAGTYSLLVLDVNECSDEVSVTILNTNGVNITSAEPSAVSGCGSSNGVITVEASGGNPPYQYKAGTVAFQESNVISGLAKGTHTVTVSDSNGCETSSSVKVLSGVSYEQQIKSIIETNCALSSCHGGNQSPNLTTFSSIKANATSIKTLTGNGSMPQGGSLTQQQKDLIACWVDDGALNN